MLGDTWQGGGWQGSPSFPTLKHRCLPKTLLLLLLEELVAGAGAGQEQPKTLGMERGDLGAAVQIWGRTLQNAPQARAAHLPIRGRDEAEEFIDVPDVEPVGVELHGCLHPLREEEIPHGPGHPPATKPGG